MPEKPQSTEPKPPSLPTVNLTSLELRNRLPLNPETPTGQILHLVTINDEHYYTNDATGQFFRPTLKGENDELELDEIKEPTAAMISCHTSRITQLYYYEPALPYLPDLGASL